MRSTRRIAATAVLLVLVGAGGSAGVAGAQPGPLPGPAPDPTPSAEVAPAPAPAPSPPRGRLPGPAPAPEPAPAESPAPSGETAPAEEVAPPEAALPAEAPPGSESAPSAEAPPASEPAPDAAPEEGAPPAAPQTAMNEDGSYNVGTQIVPGTYMSSGPVEGGVCYWKRLGAGDHDEILDNAMTKKPQTVSIEATDRAFSTSGCQPWQRSDSVAPANTLPPIVAGLQFRHWINTIDNNARQSGNGALPPR